MHLNETIFVTIVLSFFSFFTADAAVINCPARAAYTSISYEQLATKMDLREHRFEALLIKPELILKIDYEIKPQTESVKVSTLGDIEMALPLAGGLKKFGIFVVNTAKGKALLAIYHQPLNDYKATSVIQEYFSEFGLGTRILGIISPAQIDSLMALHPELKNASKTDLQDMKPTFATLIEFKEGVQDFNPKKPPPNLDIPKVVKQLRRYQSIFLKLKIMALDIQFLVDNDSNLYLTDFDDFLWVMPNGKYLEKNKEIPESDAIPILQTYDDIRNYIKNLLEASRQSH